MVLSGRLIKLRPLERGDLDRSREWVNHMETAKGLLRTLPVTQMEQDAWFERVCTDPTRMVWAIDKDQGHVGNAGLYYLDFLHRRAELWCYVGCPDSRGLGVASEAVRLLTRYAFEGLGLNKIYVHVGADNQPALKLYLGQGFKEEGRFAQEYFIGGRFLDVIRLRLLSTESLKER